MSAIEQNIERIESSTAEIAALNRTDSSDYHRCSSTESHHLRVPGIPITDLSAGPDKNKVLAFRDEQSQETLLAIAGYLTKNREFA